MQRIAMGEYELEITASPGEQAYDHSYIFSEDGWTSSISLKTFRFNEVLRTTFIAAKGGGTGIHKNSFVAQQDKIAVCCSDSIFCLSIPDLELLWRTKADEATCFEIFPYQDDYIVHGELEISRLDSNGQIIWQRNGADIFVSLNHSEEDFVVAGNHILATDWNGRKYKFDFHGNSIN